MSFATVSLLSSPQQFEPVNTDGLWFQFLSASYSQPNFNYIVDVWSWTMNPSDPAATQSLGTFKIPPRPYTGDGLFTPHKILKSQITNRFLTPISATGLSLTYGGMVQYWLDYGFQVGVDVPFETFDFFGNLALTFATGSNIFQTDDLITIVMDNQKVNPQYNTTMGVTASSGNAVVTDFSYGATPSGTETGSVYILERVNETTYASFSSATGGNYTWNAVRQYGQKGYDFSNPYVVLGTGVSSFLTSYTFSYTKPTYFKKIRLGQYEVVSVLINGDQTNGEIDTLSYVGYQNTTGASYSTIQSLTASFSLIDYKGKFDVGIGPENLKDLFPSINFTNVDWYKVYLNEGNNARCVIEREIDRSCTVYPVVQLRFLNRLGGYECYNFIRNSHTSLKTNKTEWRIELPWNYTIGDRGQAVLSQETEITNTINTDWVTDYDYTFLQELITSPEVYRVEGTYSYPIVVTDTDWKQKRQIDGNVFNMTLNYKEAYPLMTQDN